jgi:hypothetical protein
MKSLLDLIDKQNCETFKNEYLKQNNKSFFNVWEIVLHIISKPNISENTSDLIQFILKNTSFHAEIVNYKQYFLFRELCANCSDINLIKHLQSEYFIPLNCKFYGPFLKSCIQGNKELIKYFIQQRSADWTIKYFKPIKLLLIHSHYSLLIELIRENVIDISVTLFDNYFLFRYLCMSGEYENILEYFRLLLNSNFSGESLYNDTDESKYLIHLVNNLLDISIEDHFCLEKACKNGHLKVVKLLMLFYDSCILNYVTKRKNFCVIRLAALSGNLELLNLLLQFLNDNNAEPNWNNSIFFLQLCKNSIIHGNLKIANEIMNKYLQNTYEFEANVKNIFQIKADEQNQIDILNYFNNIKTISQEFLLDSFYSAIEHNKVNVADACYNLLNEENRMYLVDEITVARVQGKFTLDTRDYLAGKFPELENVFVNYQKELFMTLLSKNKFDEALKLFKKEYLSEANTLVKYACLNDNYDMLNWVLKLCKPTNFIYADTFGKVCENGNIEILKMIIDYIFISDITKGFRIACIHNKVLVMDFIYGKFKTMLDLENILIQVIYLLIQIENMETFYWFSKHINLQKFFSSNFSSFRVFSIIEGICAGNSFELFKFIIQFIPMNHNILNNIIKWSSKFNRENIILYVIDIYKLYSVDPDYIFKSAMLSKNFFIIFTDFYKKNRFLYETIKICIEKVIIFDDIQIFENIIKDYIQYFENNDEVNMIQLFDFAYEKDCDHISLAIFNKLSKFTQYLIISQLSNVTYSQNIYLLNMICKKNKYFANLLTFDNIYIRYNFNDIIKSLYQEKTDESFCQIIKYFGIETNPDLSKQMPKTTCFICYENDSIIFTNCRHFYCAECFVEFVYKYENFYCGMCRQKLNFNICYLLE